MDITIPPGETATIWLPGATAIRVDARHRVIAVDTVSSVVCDAADFDVSMAADAEPLMPEWLVEDLREGNYGDFHQLKPAAECFESTCAGQGGQHATAEERAVLRDFPEAVARPVTWAQERETGVNPFPRDAPYPGPGNPCPHGGGAYSPAFRCAACVKEGQVRAS